jgi:hypothetical protein
MALVHTVQFHSVQEMVTGVVDVFVQFTPKDPVPEWWEEFAGWVEEQKIDSAELLAKKLDEIAAGKEHPDWWKIAEKEFKAAKQIKSIEIKTESYSDDDDGGGNGDDGDSGDDDGGDVDDDGVEGGDGDFVAARDDGEDGNPADEKPEEPKPRKTESKK